LKNIIERAMIESESAIIQPAHLHFIQRPVVGVPTAVAVMLSPLAPEIPRRPATEEECILAYVQQNGSISNIECRALLGVDRHRAFYLLEKLRQARQLGRKGLSRAVRYNLSADDSA